MSDKITAVDFVTIWQKSPTLDEVCEKTGMSRITACARAARYRKIGIPLKKQPRQGRPTIDVDSLSALAKKLTK